MLAKKGKAVIWPIYLDSSRTRREGRAVSKRDAVTKPSLDEIALAALKMGLAPEVERDCRHPMLWWEKMGRVLVLKSEPKRAIVKKIGREIQRSRG